jgi:hypothetical protein
MSDDAVETAGSQEVPPLRVIPIPPHVGIGSPFQESYYDPTSQAPFGEYVKLRRGGPVDFATGQRTEEDFPDALPWRQV